MLKINQLSPAVIAKIAAGQVVDRPVSVVKELVENSLDAGAHNIRIKLEDGGKTAITVVDDGCGITADELVVATQSHTTSKIETVADLDAINSLGFRGEALWSIGQVAQLTVQSKTARDQRGSSITIENGEATAQKPVGMSVGTVVIVERLFEKIPARKKFLKSAKVELQLILQNISELAFAHPQVGFQLFNNNQLIVDVLPHASIENRVASLLTNKLNELFLPINIEVSEYSFTGFLGTPQAATTVTQQQLLIVNNRPVVHQKIAKLIKRAFKTLLPPSINPPFILYLTIKPEMIDINVHPQKKEVRFTEEEILLNVLKTLVQQTLEKANLLFAFNAADSLTLNDSKMDEGTAQLLRDATKIWNVKKHFEDEPILQINNLYLVVTTKEGFLLIDQHAAHERILYEQFLSTFLEKKLSQQNTQQQLEVSLPLLEAELLEENKHVFEGVGFVFKRNSPQTFTFYAVPTLLQTRKIEEYLLEVLRDIIDQVEVTELDLQSHRTIAYLACRNAIKAGEVLNQTERKNIVDELFKTSSKYTCPHGRPVVIEVTKNDLEKLFYRIPAFRNEK